MKNVLTLQKITIPGIVFAVLVLFSACKKEVPVTKSTSSNNPVSYFIAGNLGSEAVNISGTMVPYNNVTDNIITNTGTILATGAKFVTAGSSSSAQNTMGSIDLRRLLVKIYLTPTPAQQVNTYYTMLNVNNTMGYNSGEESTLGAYISLTDKNGAVWTSAGDQSGSTFKINSEGTIDNNTTTFSGTFSAKMYDINGNMQKLTNGSFNVIAQL